MLLVISVNFFLVVVGLLVFVWVVAVASYSMNFFYGFGGGSTRFWVGVLFGVVVLVYVSWFICLSLSFFRVSWPFWVFLGLLFG